MVSSLRKREEYVGRAPPTNDQCWVCGADLLMDDNYCRICGTQLVRPQAIADYRRRAEDSRKPVGVFLFTVGIAISIPSFLMGIVPLTALGIASFLLGVLVLYLPSGGVASSGISAASGFPSLMSIEKLLNDLDLDEKAIYIPPQGFGLPKAFVPLASTPATQKPPLGLNHSRRIFVTVGTEPQDRGVLLEAPGGELFRALEGATGTDFKKASLEDLSDLLQKGFNVLGVAKKVALKADGDNVYVELGMNSTDELERRLRNLAPRFSMQVGTPIVSCVASALSKISGRYVKVKNSVLDESEKKVMMTLRLS